MPVSRALSSRASMAWDRSALNLRPDRQLPFATQRSLPSRKRVLMRKPDFCHERDSPDGRTTWPSRAAATVLPAASSIATPDREGTVVRTRPDWRIGRPGCSIRHLPSAVSKTKPPSSSSHLPSHFFSFASTTTSPFGSVTVSALPRLLASPCSGDAVMAVRPMKGPPGRKWERDVDRKPLTAASGWQAGM